MRKLITIAVLAIAVLITSLAFGQSTIIIVGKDNQPLAGKIRAVEWFEPSKPKLANEAVTPTAYVNLDNQGRAILPHTTGLLRGGESSFKCVEVVALGSDGVERRLYGKFKSLGGTITERELGTRPPEGCLFGAQ